jgi:replicative DNA helicase
MPQVAAVDTLPPPPIDEQVEQALLAALLVRNHLLEQIRDCLRPEHFGIPVHGRIYAAIVELVDVGKPANPVTLHPLFKEDVSLEQVGGAHYLTRLASEAVVTLTNTSSLGDQIIDLCRRRRLIDAAKEMAERAAHVSLSDPAEKIIADAEQVLFEITDERAAASLVDAGESASAAIALAQQAYKNAGRLIGIPTGIAGLDDMLGGLRRGHLYILAGRPSMGKTLFADTIAIAAAGSFLSAKPTRPTSVALFSLEMTHEELSFRRLARVSKISSSDIQRGKLDSKDFDRLMAAKEAIEPLPILTDDSAGLTLADIGLRCRRIARQRGLGLVIVDHLGLLRGSQEVRRNGETAVVTEISYGLKALAKELDLPVLALSQLNRDLERRDDKRPMLADLRQSGSIEQDADVVMFVYREEYYLSRSEPMPRAGEKHDAFQTRMNDWHDKLNACRNRADIIVAKQRNGEIGVVPAFFDGAKGVFTNIDRRESL